MKSILHSNHSFIVIDFYNSYYFFRSYLNFAIVVQDSTRRVRKNRGGGRSLGRGGGDT